MEWIKLRVEGETPERFVYFAHEGRLNIRKIVFEH